VPEEIRTPDPQIRSLLLYPAGKPRNAPALPFACPGAAHVVEAVQQRLDKNPQAMRVRRETAEHPFGTLKMRMGATHFLTKRLPKVATEMALHVLAYNLTRVMNIMGIQPFKAAAAATIRGRLSGDAALKSRPSDCGHVAN
jgi:hypothetical protein